MKRSHVIIYGKVQGVWFRQSTLERAQDLGLAGWVRNLVDGNVETAFEGVEEKVEKMHAWLKDGPPLARVDEVKTIENPTTDKLPLPFEIRPRS